MLRHIICVSNKPEAPTIPPTETSRISPIAIPAIAPATPLKEFNSEIVIGISAPPTRIAKVKPKSELEIIARGSTNSG